jgi:hypothetical protein
MGRIRNGRPPRSRRSEVVAWAAAMLVILGAVAWHDPMVKSYWGTLDANHRLFMSRDSSAGRLRREPAGSHPTWIAIMRYEADLSFGLIAASAAMLPVFSAIRRIDRRAWKGPGAAACVAAVAAMALCLLEEASLAAHGRRGLWRSGTNPFPNAWPLFEVWIALAVLGAWVALAASRRWRIRRSRADRVGVALGSAWLAVLAYRIFASLFIPFGNWRY